MDRFHARQWMAAVAAAVLLGGCGASSEGAAKEPSKTESETVSLYDRGLRILDRIDSMAESEEYIKIMTVSPEVLAVVEEMGEGDYSDPKAVYEIRLSQKTMDLILDAGGVSADSLPDELRKELEGRMAVSIPTMLSAAQGVDVVAATSLLTADEYFIDESLSGNLLYLYLYDNGCCGTVVFSAHEEGIVSATGRMIKNQAVNQAEGQEELMQWITENAGIAGIEVSEVTP